MTLKDILKSAIEKLNSNGSKSAKLDAELILAKILNKSREWLIANDQYELTGKQLEEFNSNIARRLNHEPVSYINQSIEFYGINFYVDKRVLSPRVETELIVEKVVEQAPQKSRLLDMGTGSGAIAIAIKKNRQDLEIVATDVSTEALEVAKYNAKKILGENSKITFLGSDIWNNIEGKFDVVATNLPYVSESYKPSMKPEVLKEPAVALFGGKEDGLDLYRKFYQDLSSNLANEGIVYHESDPWQHEKLIKLATDAGLTPILEDYLILGFKKI